MPQNRYWRAGAERGGEPLSGDRDLPASLPGARPHTVGSLSRETCPSLRAQEAPQEGRHTRSTKPGARKPPRVPPS